MPVECERDRQRLSNVHKPQTWVLALHTDLINVLMAPCLPANEQLMLSSPAVLKSNHFEIATVMITSSILHEFGCKRICSTPSRIRLSPLPMWPCLISSHDHDTLGSGCDSSFSLQTYGSCRHAVLCVRISISLRRGRPDTSPEPPCSIS